MPGFYLRHPERVGPLLASGLHALSEPRPDYLGSYPFHQGDEPSFACRFCLASTVTMALEPVGPFVWPATWLVELALAVAALRRRRREVRALGGATLFALGIAVTGLATALLGDGEYELPKHLYLAQAANLLAVVLAVATAAQLWTRRGAHGLPPGTRVVAIAGDDPFLRLMEEDAEVEREPDRQPVTTG